jgi:hypothetical protein
LQTFRVGIVTTASAVLFTALVLVACGGDDASSSSSSGQPPSPDAAALPETSNLPALNPALCEKLPLGTKIVDELAMSGDALPPLGGAFAPGIYDLEELDAYNAFDAGISDVEHPTEGVTGRSASAILVVTSNTFAIVEAYGTGGNLDPPTNRGYDYYPRDTTIYWARVCPDALATKGIPYSAVGDTLAIFTDENHREVFRRRPEQ